MVSALAAVKITLDNGIIDLPSAGSSDKAYFVSAKKPASNSNKEFFYPLEQESPIELVAANPRIVGAKMLTDATDQPPLQIAAATNNSLMRL